MSSPPPHIHVIARAVVVLDGLLLVARRKGAPNTFLPGGHVEEGERMHDAVARELKEETGRSCVVGPYLGAVEHAFVEGRTTQHEVNHLFGVSLPGISAGAPLRRWRTTSMSSGTRSTRWPRSTSDPRRPPRSWAQARPAPAGPRRSPPRER